jgi:hypothetical protein
LKANAQEQDTVRDSFAAFLAIAIEHGLTYPADGVSRSAARRFAEQLILCSDRASATSAIHDDWAGAKSLLGVGLDLWQIEGVGAHVSEPIGEPPHLLFFPFASWSIDALANYPAQFGPLTYRT